MITSYKIQFNGQNNCFVFLTTGFGAGNPRIFVSRRDESRDQERVRSFVDVGVRQSSRGLDDVAKPQSR
jgi:hypothetical protein